MTYLRKKS